MEQALKHAIVPTGTHVLYGDDHDFRTRAANYLMDPVLPVVTLLFISALTVAIIVIMVTAIATAFLHAQPENVIDPWANVSSSSGMPYDDEPVYPGDAWLESRTNGAIEPPTVARWMP
jgi:hypothetical protein